VKRLFGQIRNWLCRMTEPPKLPRACIGCGRNEAMGIRIEPEAALCADCQPSQFSTASNRPRGRE
jgi:hypothetical protein